MSILYTWKIHGLDTSPSSDGLTNVVKTIHWEYHGDDGTHRVEYTGSLGLSAPDATNFTQYSDLTESQIISWLESNLDVQALRNNLNKQFQHIYNPPVVQLPLPWQNS